MKLRNEGVMYIVIFISLSFHETFSLNDEYDYFDSDLIPFISISTKKANTLLKTEENSKSTKTTSQARFFNSNIQIHPYVSITAMPTRHNDYTQSIMRNVLKSEVNGPISVLYKILKANITEDSKRNRIKDNANIMKVKNSDFLNKNANQQFANYSPSDFKRTEKLKVLNKTNIHGPLHTDDRAPSGIMKRNNEYYDKYTFSKFFDSLLSLLSYLSPNLLNVLDENIKRFQRYNLMKRDSMTNNSQYQSYPYECSRTLKTMLCNCDYCRTGEPDTVLYIVSGKKLNNSVTYHKLTSINRSKSKTSHRYQLQTADDNDSNRSLCSRYLPANYDRPLFGNNFDEPINEKDINSYERTIDSHNRLPMMKLVPVSRNMGKILMSAYKGLKDRGFYKPSNVCKQKHTQCQANVKFNESQNIAFRKVIEPRSHKYKPIFYFGNNPFPYLTDSKNNEENQYDETYYNKGSIERHTSSYLSTTQSIEFGDYSNNGWNMSDSDKSSNHEATNESTYRSLNRSNTGVNETYMSNSEEKIKTNNNLLSVKNDTNENIDILVPNTDSIEAGYEDAESVIAGAHNNTITFHPGPVKKMIKNNFLKNIFHKEHFKKVPVAVDSKTSTFLPRVTIRAFAIPPIDVNEGYKYTQATHEASTVSNEQNHYTEPLKKSIIDIINKMMDEVEVKNVSGTNHIEITTNSITLSNDENNIIKNYDFKNSSTSKHSYKREYSTAFSEKSGSFYSKHNTTDSTVQPSLITTNVTTIKVLNNSVNKKETYVNYDLNLRNLIGESNIDDKIMCS